MLSGVTKLIDKLPVPRWLVNIIGLKIIYQIVYIIFSLIIIKKLSIAEFGFYSYVVALIVYFSTIPLLGFPTYLQRNAALQNGLSVNYFFMITGLMVLSISLAFLVMPNMMLSQKMAVAVIILVNCFITILVSINDGVGRYSFQYKLFFLTNMWMIICTIQTVFLNHKMTFNLLLNYWFFNSVLVLIVGGIIFMRLIRSSIKLTMHDNTAYSFIFADLILLYAVGIPDGFARFYDKFLANHFLSDTFLGHYSFNLMAVMAIYALFIRPVNSVLFTQMVKTYESLPEYVKFIKKYYLYGLSIYLFCYIIYVPFSKQILNLFGLSKYIGPIGFFKVCFLNALLYLIATPFTNLIALSKSGQKKLIYCVCSLLVFNVPLALLYWQATELNFFIGFILAYALNFLLCIALEPKAALFCFYSIKQDLINLAKYQYKQVKADE